MSNGIKSRVEDLKASFGRMSARERRMVGALAGTFACLVVLAIGYWISSSLDELEERNQEIRQILRDIDKNRDEIVGQRQRLAALEVRMGHAPLDLNTYVDRATSAVGISIAESDETTPVPADQYTRRGLRIRLTKVTIAQLATLLKKLEEEQAHIVQVTALSVNTRWNRNQELDVDLEVSTYDRNRKDARSAPSQRGGRS
jgi:type II secretory pathway component PulM